jgi:protein-arginine kinase activator protein McsA
MKNEKYTELEHIRGVLSEFEYKMETILKLDQLYEELQILIQQRDYKEIE